MTSPFELANRAASELRMVTGMDRFDVGVILGSGWKEGAIALGEPEHVIDTSSLSGFFAPSVPGHRGEIISLLVGDLRVALVAGRVHLYEGHSAHEVVHPVRTLIAAGATTMILTNAAGGLDPEVAPGSVVLIRDHINQTGTSPLEGEAPPASYGSRFVDLTDLYSERLRSLVKSATPSIREGVYFGLRGPHYETPAEIEMMRRGGATLVGMSTVLEAIAARHLGAQVLGFSLVSNLAAGISDGPLNHVEVLEAGQSASASLGATLLSTLLSL